MYLARHGQTIFNVVFGTTKRDPGVQDPPLTEKGHAQAHELARHFAELEIDRVISSPYTRALQTAHEVANRLDVPITIDANARERSAYACDVGTETPVLANAWPHLDFSHLPKIWWDQEEEPLGVFHERCTTFRKTVACAVNWDRIAVITHWGVIRSLTGRSVGNAELLRCDPRDHHLPLD
ncbi:MAG: phosphoglycerate mutase GpmB [Alphaproteobacteria bacterium MarineAlpha11_Bin1]|nr:MAG: phosphoglycerate mutase GpmB [Alphaproteobacteria bacterium MarineAlpha11_Bin1]|tara:strand:+ start:16523 stop:17065 length:543 start_codon:yes stop_codon:yes gene_type:complete